MNTISCYLIFVPRFNHNARRLLGLPNCLTRVIVVHFGIDLQVKSLPFNLAFAMH